MSKKKFFTLLKGEEIRASEGCKVIPAAHFSVLQDASAMLNAVVDEAKHYRLKISQEAEQIKENGFREGYQEGLKQWATHLTYFEEELQKIRKETKNLIIPIALKAAKKIVGREIELSKDVIVDIVLSNLKAVAQHKKITIYVNKSDLESLENNKPRLREIFEELESLSVRAREDIEKGGCVIETEVGIINDRFEHRWEILEKALEALMKKSLNT